eukprot:10531822-Heterocapsa_arctica.AAC.1
MGHPALRFEGRAIPLYERTNLFYLPVSLAGERMSPECRRQLQDATTTVRRELDAVAPAARD